MQPDEVPVTVVEDTTMETEEDDSSDDDDDSWNCADAEIKDELDSAITANLRKIMTESQEKDFISSFKCS